MKLPLFIIMIIVCVGASFASAFEGEVYHSIELMGIAILLASHL